MSSIRPSPAPVCTDTGPPYRSGRGMATPIACCGRRWAGPDRAHCCRRHRGCGHVFDDADLWDAHRPRGHCLPPDELGLVLTSENVWVRVLLSPSP
ncbi:MAG: hypothetical protein ACQEWQ_26295 [Actinomycetota bacterium]